MVSAKESSGIPKEVEKTAWPLTHNVNTSLTISESKGIIPKFYFIVDRLDLLIQAGKEFRARPCSA